MKGQKFILAALGIYITAGIATLLYLPSHSMDTAVIVDHASITTTGVAVPSDTAPAVPATEEPASSEQIDDTSPIMEPAEEPLFIDIKGTPVYKSKYYNYEACHTEGNLFIRTAPGLAKKILDRLTPGDTGMVLAVDTEWSYVHYQDKEGYIFNQYLAFTEREPTPEELASRDSTTDTENTHTKAASAETATQQFTVISDVNLRSNASPKSNVLGILYTGDTGTVLTYDETWCYVESGDLSGYVNTSYLQIQ
ncbi:MAG: SH3 domain-containing protein [Lachnospiraceae bacterium]|nr:SH3 domain-containing protein [Lachnospiraceae bacterium]